jgi:trigger factor
MALISSKVVDTNRSELIIEAKGEIFTKAVDRSFAKNSKSIAVPGFRKGKAPRAMIEKMYGKEVFYDDAINEIYPAVYSEAVTAAGIYPVDAADVEVVEINDEGVVLKATVTTKPVPTLGEYKGLTAVKTVAAISDADVDAQVARVREQYARLVPVEDRAAQLGDTAVIDFEGFVDNVAFDGGKGDNYALELGSNTFIPGFEDQVAGHSVGEEFDVNVTFPEEYAEASLAGKPAVFKCKINGIKVKELPELDDDFAKDISEFDTFAAYRDDLKAKMETGAQQQADVQFENELLMKVVENMTVEVPECMIKSAINDCLNDYGMRLGQQGLSLDDFVRYTGQTREQFAESFRPTATNQVKSRLALEAIAAAENLTVSDEELTERFAKMAEEYKVDVEKLKQYIAEEDVKGDMLCRKAMDFVVANGVATDAPAAEETPAAEEAPAEKPAPKKRATKKAAAKTEEEGAEKPAPKKRTTKKAAAKTEEKTEE